MKFLNRINERRELINFIKHSEKDNEIIIIAGPSGVGKSELVQFILEHEIPGDNKIRVKININKASSSESYHYLNLLYKAVFYHVHSNKKYILENYSKDNVFRFSNLFRLAIDWGKNRLGFSESARLFEPVQQPDIIWKKEYIENVLSGKGYIVTIENFQNIDISSLEVLDEIITKTNNLIFLFEYTRSINDEDNILNIYNSMSRICGQDRVELLHINKLDFTEARHLIADNSCLTDADINALEKIYNDSGGNLIHIILAKYSIGTNHVPIEAAIENLSKDARYILGIIYWLETEIGYTELFELTTEPYTSVDIAFSFPKYEKCYHELCAAKVIVSTNNVLQLRHDSIITAIKNRPKEPILSLAYGAVKKYYHSIMKDPLKKIQIVERLFSLYIKGGDIDIVNLLPEIRIIVLREKYPDNIIRKLSFLEQKLLGASTSFRKYAYEALAEICHAIGIAEQGENYLNQIYDASNPFHFALKAGILALKYHVPACQYELDIMASTPSDNPRLQIMVGLCRLSGVMMVSRKSTGKEYAEQLLANSEYIEFVEYGLLLRNYAELIDDIPTSIRIYERALDIFKAHRQQRYEADVYVALSMLYAYLGDINRAEEYLTFADNTNKEMEKSTFYNNMAAISILKGTYDKETLRNLNNALLLNNYDYDKCIIKCNLLIYYCLINNMESANEICMQIENSEYGRYDYDEFKHIIYVNLLFFSKYAHDKYREELYTNKLKELADSDDVCESVVRLIRANLMATEDTKYFYSKFPYRVDFLCNWSFWIDGNIAQTRNC